MSEPVLALLGAIIVVVGLLIGSVGVGGVLLVPALVYIAGMPIHAAIAAAMAAYFFAGMLGSIEYARSGSIKWREVGWLSSGAMPGAFVGAYAVHATDARLLESLIGALIVVSAINTLRRRDALLAPPSNPTPRAFFAIGLLTGIGSAMSGTGGPLVLVPLLLGLRMAVLPVVGLSQAVQMPISISATLGNSLQVEIDFKAAALITGLLMIGVWFGARLAHRLPGAAMKRAVASLLLVVGFSLLARASFEWLWAR
ncbi:sulfite exporter TauE/SafE family protein [Thioalkalivibrio sp. HK1]|uniref:sulfite exporter TauE/SafE family protein n=1 Tax=Thioalkalivibrio sp. HK1 TaxID=1469245 RepID=UPI0005701C61|nr:sulfite exporter TauE/SafE family protein [Thioalkalivibrio sp. HK1]